MKKLVALTLVFISGVAQAALHDRGSGLVYDDVLDVTWADESSGLNSWHDSVAWTDSLSLYDSVRDVTWDDWRMPSMDLNGDGTIVDCASASEVTCRDNELGYAHFYGGGGGGHSWSSTEWAPDPVAGAHYFDPYTGVNRSAFKTAIIGVRAVRNGDVAAVPVEINLDPWSTANLVRPHHSGLLYVAVMGSSIASGDAIDFDVTLIDPDSLKFAAAEAPNIALSPLYGDYDNDSNMDAAFIFETADTSISCYDTEVTLTGAASGPVPFEGSDTINTIDCEAVVLPLENPSPDPDDRFGTSVSVAGNRVLVGAYFDDTVHSNSGQAYLFDASTGNLANTFHSPSPDPYWDYFGESVGVSGDRVLISAPNVPAVYLYDAVTANLQHTYTSPTGPGDYFGTALSVSGDRVLVGAFGDNTTGAASGRAYLFDAVSGNLIHTFENPSPDTSDHFGISVSVSGDRVLVGAHYDDTTGNNSGRAYLFDAVTGSLIHTLENPGPEPAGDNFGYSVSLSDDRIAVGAFRDNSNGSYSGRAYLFDAVTGNLEHTLESPSPEAYDDFGISVGVSGDRVLVGAERAAIGNTGRAYLFDAVTGDLTQILENPSPAGVDSFGSVVSVSGDIAVVGAFREGATGFQSGRAYLFYDVLPAQVEVTPLAHAPYNGSLHLHHQGQGAFPDDTVPVVVLGLKAIDGDPVDLDVSLIDTASVRLGPGEAPIDPATIPNLSYDHDSDGNPDARFEFKMSETGFTYTPGTGDPCSAPATLSGELTTGELFAGEDLTVDKDCNASCH